MKSQNCNHIQAQLLDYIEREMSSDERERVSEHLADCRKCNKEYKGLQAMLDTTKNLSIEDPGEEFWQQLPQKVLVEVRQRKKNITDNKVVDLAIQSTQRRPVADPAPAPREQTARINPADFKVHKLTAVAAIAAILLLAINVTLLSTKSATHWFDQEKLQAGIDAHKGLSRLAQALPQPLTANPESGALGFVEQHRSDKAYAVGWTLAAAFAYLRDNRFQSALQQLRALRQSLQQRQTSAVILGSVQKATELLQTLENKPDNAAKTQVAQLLAQFQNDYKHLVIQGESRQRLLYRAGIWVFNANLMVAAQDRVTANWRELAGPLDYLQKAFARINAPVGVQNSLREISQVMSLQAQGHASLSRKDFRTLQSELQNLNNLLS